MAILAVTSTMSLCGPTWWIFFVRNIDGLREIFLADDRQTCVHGANFNSTALSLCHARYSKMSP
jgi:hypothetical protein